LRACTWWEFRCLLAGHALANGGTLATRPDDLMAAEALLDRAIAAGPLKG
jgi:hypothetical protein